MNEFVNIPKDLLQLLVAQLKGSDIINLCESSPRLNKTCLQLSDKFWAYKYLKDYKPSYPYIKKPLYLTWGKFYYAYTKGTIKTIALYGYNNFLELIWIYHNMTYNNLISEIRSVIKAWNTITINRENHPPIIMKFFRIGLEITPDDIHLNDKIDYDNIYEIKVS